MLKLNENNRAGSCYWDLYKHKRTTIIASYPSFLIFVLKLTHLLRYQSLSFFLLDEKLALHVLVLPIKYERIFAVFNNLSP